MQNHSSDLHRALALQFVLKGLLSTFQAFQTNTPWERLFSPQTLVLPELQPSCYLNKLFTHSLRLKNSVPTDCPSAHTFHECLSHLLFSWGMQPVYPPSFLETLQSLYQLLEPLICICKEDENLFLFLLQHNALLDQLFSSHYLRLFFQDLYPEGWQLLEEKMCQKYLRRGFFSQVSEIKDLLSTWR